METIKLLPSSKKINTSSFLGKEKKESGGIHISSENLNVISTKVITIEKLLEGQNKLLRSKNAKIKKEEETQKRSKKESELEKPKDKEEKDGRKLLKGPRLGFLDRIKNFLGKMILGFIAVRLIPYLPDLLKIVPKIAAVNEFFIDTGMGLVDGLATFVQKGYEAYDFTKKSLKSFGGDNIVKLFDSFNGAVGKVIEASIIAALAFGELGGGDSGGSGGGRPTRGFDRTGRRVGKEAQRRFAERYGRDEFIKRFGKDNLKNLPKSMQRGFLQKGARNAFVGVLGKGGAKSVLGFVRPLLKRIPIPVVGALIDFGLSVALGESPGRAAFKAIGAGLLGTIGAALGGPFAVLTGIAGGMLGDWAGGALYDVFFGNKKPQKPKGQGRAEGGAVTRSGKLQGSVSRRIKKTTAKRVVKPTVTKLKPGSSVGGKQKLEKVFPETNKPGTVNPLGYIEETYDNTNKIQFFGPIFDIAYKTISGDKPTRVDYKNASIGLNSWMNDTFNPEVMRRGGFAGGGEVNAEMFMKGEDLTNVIAKSLEDSISKKVDDTIGDLNKQLSLRQPETKLDKSDPTLDVDDGDGEIYDGDITPGLWGPLLDLIAGKESGGNYEAMYPSTTLRGATKMTISEVARRATGAVGKYQQLPQYLVGRAKAAGLNPDKDLYSPENQDLIITKVNIKGRGGERWLKGEISDEQFMQGLSQEFASLPNAQGVFYYPGQRSAMTPQKIKQALSRVKSGGNGTVSRSHRGELPGDIMGKSGSFGLVDPTPKSSPGVRGSSGYAADSGLDIVGKTGDPIVSPVSGTLQYAETGHTSWSDDSDPGTPGRQAQHSFLVKLSKPFKYGGKVVKYAYGTHLSSLSRSVANKSGISIRAGQTIGRMGVANRVPHLHLGLLQNRAQASEADWLSNTQVKSVLSARLARGGLVRGFTKAILGERGVEFVLDNDTTMALQKTFPGFLDALNRANFNDAVNVLRNYASYEVGAMQEVQINNNIINVIAQDSAPQTIMIGGDGGMDDFTESLAAGH